MAQILSDDQVRSEFFERLRIDGIETFAAGDVFANQPIDFRRRSILRDAGVNDYFFCAGLRGKVAFVADADDFAIEAQGEEDFCGGGGEGNDTQNEDSSRFGR